MLHLLQDRDGYSMTWWAGFCAFLLLPMLTISVSVGRYAIAASEVQAGADLAALAAVRDVDVAHFEHSGNVRFLGALPYGRAASYANLNTDYLASEDIQVYVTDIQVDNANDMVLVECSADVSQLFSNVISPAAVVQRTGTARVRMQTQ